MNKLSGIRVKRLIEAKVLILKSISGEGLRIGWV